MNTLVQHIRAAHAIFHVQVVQQDYILIVYHVIKLVYINTSINKIINVLNNVVLMNIISVSHVIFVIINV